MGTFNPADYSVSMSTDGCGTKLVVWVAAQKGPDEIPEALAKPHGVSQELPSKSSYGLREVWKNSVEEWTTEDWTEYLSETKVFTASSSPAENHVTTGQSIDLVPLLHKPPPPTQAVESYVFETSQHQGFGQALVFTNYQSQQSDGTRDCKLHFCQSPQSLSSLLVAGFGELSQSKMVNIFNSQILNKLKPPDLSPFLAASSAQQNNSVSPPPNKATTAAWDLRLWTSQPSVLSHLNFKSQPEPSPVLNHLSQ